MKKHLTAIMAAAMLAAGLSSCDDDEKKAEAIELINTKGTQFVDTANVYRYQETVFQVLNDNLLMTKGQTVENVKLVKGSLKYSSSDENVATVDENGKVTALSFGRAAITATAPNGHTHTFYAMVNDEVSVTINGKKIVFDDFIYLPQNNQFNLSSINEGMMIYLQWEDKSQIYFASTNYFNVMNPENCSASVNEETRLANIQLHIPAKGNENSLTEDFECNISFYYKPYFD